MNETPLPTPMQPEYCSGDDKINLCDKESQPLDVNNTIEKPQDENPLVKELLDYLSALPEDETNQYNPQDRTDLYTLFSELAVMKTELKQASRGMKAGLEDFKSVFLTLEKSNEALITELNQRKSLETEKIQEQVCAKLKPQLIYLVELYDRIDSSILSYRKHKPNFLARMFGKKTFKFINAQKEGQHMLLSRIEQELARNHVVPIQALNQPFDATCMCAIGTKNDVNKANGIVLEEIRRGFFWQNTLLRSCDVIVNKQEK